MTRDGWILAAVVALALLGELLVGPDPAPPVRPILFTLTAGARP